MVFWKKWNKINDEQTKLTTFSQDRDITIYPITKTFFLYN